MKEFAEKISKEKGMSKEFDLYERVEKLALYVVSRHRKMYKGVSANVDFYSGFVYKMLELSLELYTPILYRG